MESGGLSIHDPILQSLGAQGLALLDSGFGDSALSCGPGKIVEDLTKVFRVKLSIRVLSRWLKGS